MSFHDNAGARRYELEIEGHTSFAEYLDGGASRMIMHVETPEAARGRGHAEKLMRAIVEDARATGAKLTPRCSYAVAYFRRNKDAADVLA